MLPDICLHLIVYHSNILFVIVVIVVVVVVGGAVYPQIKRNLRQL